MDADGGATYEVDNPATGEVIASVAYCGSDEARRAIDHAEAAQRLWCNSTAKERGDLLRAWFEQIIAHQDDLAQILTLEQGKPLSEASGEIAYGASYVEWFAEEAKRIYGDVIAPPSNDKRVVCIRLKLREWRLTCQYQVVRGVFAVDFPH